jgi:hypothetical protein
MDSLQKDDGLRVVEDDNIQQPPHYRPDGPPQVLTADTVRQAPAGRRVLLVLVASLVAIGIAWLIVTAFAGHGL